MSSSRLSVAFVATYLLMFLFRHASPAVTSCVSLVPPAHSLIGPVPYTYQSPPKVVVWLNLFDMNANVNWRVKTFATDVTATGFNLHIDTWSDTKIMCTMASWIAYPAHRPGLASGSFSTRDIRSPGQPQLYNSAFEPFPAGVFKKPPRVFLAINSLEIDHEQNLRLKVSADNVSATGMTWHLNSWSDTLLLSAGASYIAFG